MQKFTHAVQSVYSERVQESNAGVLIGSMAEGTIGRMVAASKKRNLKIIYPAGLEKLIPVSIGKASKETGSNKNIDYSMSIPCSLMPLPGVTVTEVDAFRILARIDALPISAGGLGGAEGAIVLLLQGEETAVRKAVSLTESVKGARMREVRNPDCPECIFPTRHFTGKKMSWA